MLWNDTYNNVAYIGKILTFHAKMLSKPCILSLFFPNPFYKFNKTLLEDPLLISSPEHKVLKVSYRD